MNCWRVQNLVAPFLEGLLPSAECTSVEEHLEGCPECQELVSGVAALPDLSPPSIGGVDEAALMDSLQQCIEQSIAESRADDFLPMGASPLEVDAEPTNRIAARGGARSGPLQISVGLAAAYLAVALLLAGGVVINHLRVRSLEASIASRDALIDALQDRLVTQEQPTFADYALVPGPSPVFLPAAAPGALSPFGNGTNDVSSRGGLAAPYRQVSLDGMPVIH
ncbi:MAG: hypothetical protein CL928_10700 [Deltaproteobacteria bacterium]|nr:hypothetical protein [Deltaproteobacteria bacterium]